MTIVIEPRYSGPPNTGNGGYVAGRFAAGTEAPAEVTLRKPIPLGVPLTPEHDTDTVRIRHGDTLIATVTPSMDRPPPLPEPVSPTDARTAAAKSRLRQHPADHPFPGCFVCGPDNPAGLHILVGPVSGRHLAADLWTPAVELADGDEVRPEFVWAALDCSGGLGAFGDDPADVAYLLGRITVWPLAPVRAGEPHVVLGWREGVSGRKLTAGSAIQTAAGESVAVARATWIRVG